MKIWARALFIFMIYLLSILFVFFLLKTLVLYSASANSWHNLQQGDQTAQSLFNQIDQKKTEAGAHPFHQGTSKESYYRDSELGGRSQAAASQDPAAQMIYQSSDARPQVRIDPKTDPLLRGANQIMENPLEVIGGKGTQVDRKSVV